MQIFPPELVPAGNFDAKSDMAFKSTRPYIVQGLHAMHSAVWSTELGVCML